MTKLHLPSITLATIETQVHDLASLALQDCCNAADFAAIVTLSDRPFFPGATHMQVPNWPTKLGWSEAIWYELPRATLSDFVLTMQYDSWIIDPDMWTDDFLTYDFIGPPWWYNERNVGCGGFCIKSSRLIHFINDHREEFPFKDPEDDVLSREYRPRLETYGFRWAPDDLALRFAFECVRPSLTSRHFGFHAMRYWPMVLEGARWRQRRAMAHGDPFINTKNKTQLDAMEIIAMQMRAAGRDV